MPPLARVGLRPVHGLALAGFLATSMAVVGGGRASIGTAVAPTSWLGLLTVRGYRPGDPWFFGAFLFSGIALLVLLWLVALRMCDRGTLSKRGIWALAAIWSAPFVAGPPLISKDVYVYAAHGLMLRGGVDVYSSGVSALARTPTVDAARALAAVDPRWRDVSSPYGPLASAIEKWAAQLSGGNAVGTVVVLRTVAVLSVIAAGLLAADLAGPRRTRALALFVLNPLVLIHLISGAHFEAEMVALLLAGLVAARRNRWLLAVILVCASGAVKAPALVALPALMVVHALRDTWRVAARDALVAGASFGAMALLVPDGLGWISNLSTPSHARTTSAPSAVLGDLLTPLLPAGAAAAVGAGARIIALLIAAAIVIALSVTAGLRPLEVTVGLGLLAVALLAPVIYPWYLLWGVACLVATTPPAHSDWFVGLCGLASVATITGAPPRVTTALDVLAVAVTLYWLTRRRRRRQGLRPRRHASAERSRGAGTGRRMRGVSRVDSLEVTEDECFRVR